MNKITKNYINELTFFNITLKESSKTLFEEYSGLQNIADGKELYLVFDTDTIKAKFVHSTFLNQMCIKPLEGENTNLIDVVTYLAKKMNVSYLRALKTINQDFNLMLQPTEEVELQSLNDDYLYAKANGIFEKRFNPGLSEPSDKNEGVLFLSGIELCGVGGISMIIGQPGFGKSNVCEIICAKYCNPDIDGLRFSFNQNSSGKIIYVDMERAERHLHKGWQKTVQRCGLDINEAMKKMIFLGYKDIANRASMLMRLNTLERDVVLYSPEVLIIDGVAKLIEDINNLNECVEFIRWLSNLAEQYKLTVIVTIHSNPSDYKAQGHLGSGLMREAESVLSLEYDDETSQRLLTTDFKYGKVRGDSDKVDSCFEWSQTQNGFVSCERIQKKKEQNSPVVVKTNVLNAFEGKEKLSYKELAESMALLTGNSYETERKKIAELIKSNFVELKEKYYYLHPAMNIM